jgi:hypothetical protein
MKKVTIIIAGGFLLTLIIIFLTQKPKTPISPVSKNQLLPTKIVPLSAQLKTYTNPSGFSFQYPKSLLLTEKKINDQSIYAWVELTDPQKKGSVSIKLEGSDLAKIDDWFTVTRKNSIKGEIKKVKLADLEGREFTAGNKTTTLALDQGGVLISIITDLTLPIHQQIISSFVFIQPTQTTTNASGDGSGDIIFEGEEVIQ